MAGSHDGDLPDPAELAAAAGLDLDEPAVGAGDPDRGRAGGRDEPTRAGLT
jgi:hypothetical protein